MPLVVVLWNKNNFKRNSWRRNGGTRTRSPPLETNRDERPTWCAYRCTDDDDAWEINVTVWDFSNARFEWFNEICFIDKRWSRTRLVRIDEYNREHNAVRIKYRYEKYNIHWLCVSSRCGVLLLFVPTEKCSLCTRVCVATTTNAERQFKNDLHS